MKIIVSSDKKTFVNAQQIEHFFVIKNPYKGEAKEIPFLLCAGRDTLSYHKSEARAITELNKLAVTLSTDSDNLLYYMEDTN